MSGVFDRGDVIRLRLSPTEGRELRGEDRVCLVLSPAEFNRFGMTLVAGITQGGLSPREQGFAVTLMGCGSKTQGVVLLNQVRMLDTAKRKAQFVETIPTDVVDEVAGKLAAIAGYE